MTTDAQVLKRAERPHHIVVKARTVRCNVCGHVRAFKSHLEALVWAKQHQKYYEHGEVVDDVAS